MSYILDALRKSEREREQAEPLVLNPISSDGIELPRRRLGPAAGVAALAIGAVALSAYWVFATGRSALTAPTVAPTSATARSAEADSARRPETAAVQKSAEAEVRLAPKLRTSPFAAARPSTATRDLANEVRVEPAQPRAETLAAPVAPTASTATAAAGPREPPASSEPIKFLRAMPSEFQRQLPELKVSIHIYAPRETDRILYINDRQYHVGDRLRDGDGIVVVEIVQEGVVLSYRGQQFKLPRPT